MFKKKYTIISIVVLLFVGVIFFVIWMQTKAEKDLIPSIDCESLSEEQCVESLDCKPTYGGSCSTCMDYKYLGCIADSDKRKTKEQCDADGLKWTGSSCECPFDFVNIGRSTRGKYGQLGCISDTELCLQTGGMYDRSATYNSNCFCPVGHYWDFSLGCTKIADK